jgi:pilus assembly protein FimV
VSRFTIAILAAALSLAAPLAAYAAGLGRLTVWSPLGQPLDAEIEIVSLQSGEEQGLSARIAPIEAFRQAGIEPSAVLVGARLTVERRDGRSVIRIRTAQPVSEPFLDLLVELQWTNGRLVREYTFLLDPPEYKGPQAIAAAPVTKPAAPEAQPLPPVEAKPEPQPAPAAPAKEPAVAAAASPPATATYEVQKGDTLGAIARQNVPPGIGLNQMLIAIYRANQDAFIRENINLVRAGRILTIPDADSIGTITADEANGLVQTHTTEFAEYRTRLAAAPARADETPGQRAVAGQIEAKPEAPAPGAQQEQLRLSKADPQKPAAPGSRAASEDDAVARERALKEAQSRVADLEKNVADLQKLLELKNQQLAELEKRATAQPAPAVPAPAPKPEAVKPPAAAEAAKPAPEAAKPAPATIPPKPAAAPEAKKAAPEAKPKPKAAPPPPAPSLIDEFLENPIALAGLALVILLLVGYGYWSWRRKKATHAKFQDSVFGAAAGAGAGAAFGAAAAGAAAPQPAAGSPEEVDPIAEADVYMAYGRDAQAEEILKEALQKDANRVPVHTKLLEIYASRRDAKAFEQTALKVKSLTGGSGPEWEKAATLGRSVDPQNGLYAGAPGAPAAAPTASVPAAAAAAAAPTLDFDLGGATTPGTGAPDITLDEGRKAAPAPSVDFDLGAATTPAAGSDFSPGGTLIMEEKKPESTVSGLDFDLDIGGPGEKKPEAPAAPPPSAPAESAGGLDFDLNLDLGGGEKPAEPEKPAAAPMDLSSISLDLGTAGEPSGTAAPSNDPKWQEVATKLDLAKAYEEMGDKDGARELLNEVMKDGDATQKGQAQQLLAKLG